MTNLRPKRKAKIHPSPPPSSPLAAICILPPTLLTIVSLLSPSDREVLAYLILRSLQSPTTACNPKPPNKKCATPAFDCGCFDCYTSFWVRWDASPNRELIHQAIEAFEDHIADLSANTPKALPRRAPREQCGKWSTLTKKGTRKTDRVSARETKMEGVVAQEELAAAGVACAEEENAEEEVREKGSVRRSAGGGGSSCSSRRGLVRKVWPDVLGLCNSRLWSLWCPNV